MLVVGAGHVGERKVLNLREAGAQIIVVAPKATEALVELAREGAITWHRRGFVPEDLDGAWLAVAATGDKAIQRVIADEAERRRTFLVAVDDVPNASAYSGGVLRRDPYVIAISSSGTAPALTRLLREILEQVLPDEDWVKAATLLREKWRAEGTPMSARFGELVKAFQEKARRGDPTK